MKTELTWIDGPWPGRLAIMPRPRGGDWLADEVRAWQQAGVHVIVSLLPPDEIADLGLAEEEELCRASGIQFLSFPIPDRNIPHSLTATSELLHQLSGCLADGKNVAVHCRQGVGRAGLIAAGLLVFGGVEPEMAIQRISAARGCRVPETPAQKQWIEDWFDYCLENDPRFLKRIAAARANVRAGRGARLEDVVRMELPRRSN